MSDVYSDLMLHWISTNVYKITRKNILVKLEKLMKTYSDLRKYPKKKRGNANFQKLETFNTDCAKLFDVECNDPIRLKDQEKKWKVKCDVEFYNGMAKIPQVS